MKYLLWEIGLKEKKEEYYVVSQKEHIIDCKHTKGKVQIPILNKRIINKET